MSLPYKRIPAGIAAFTSPTGKLPASQLSNVAGVGDFQLQAARSMRALIEAARADGLVVASVGDYRSYDEQVNLFKSRYTHGRNGTTTDRFWHSGTNGGDDQWWRLVAGAAAAEPGTSNHGIGLANDFALLIGGQIVTLDTKTGPNNINLYDWLSLFGGRYGWNWGETTSERWHWVYIEGDVIPAAVLSFERAHNIVFDFAFNFTDALHLAASGIPGLVRYAGDSSRSKVAGVSEINLIHAAGMAMAAVFEDSAASWQTGKAGGVTRGIEAQNWRRTVGWPADRPIYLADFDTNIPASSFPLAAEHMIGFNQSVPGVNGAYAEGDFLDYLFDRGLIGFGWQSSSDSFPGNAKDNPRACMWQRVRASFPQFPAGLYDENDLNPRTPDWGQIPKPTPNSGDDMDIQPYALYADGATVYLVPFDWSSKVPLGVAASPAVVEAQAILNFANATKKPVPLFDSTVHTNTALNVLRAIPVLTDDSTAAAVSALAAQVTALSTKVGAPAQAAVTPTTTTMTTGLTKVTTDVNAHTDDALAHLVLPTPPPGPPPDMTKVVGHQPSQGDITFTQVP